MVLFFNFTKDENIEKLAKIAAEKETSKTSIGITVTFADKSERKTFFPVFEAFSKNFSQLLNADFEVGAHWNLPMLELDQISDHLLPNYGNSEAI